MRRRNPYQVNEFSKPLLRPDMDRIILRMLAELADSNMSSEAESLVLIPIMGRLEDRGEEIIESGELAERPETEEEQLLVDELHLIQAVHTILDVLQSRLNDMRPMDPFYESLLKRNPRRRRRLKRYY